MTLEMDETKLRDGGVLDGGREHEFTIACGRRFAVSESLLQTARDDVMKSVRRLADGHLEAHHKEGVAEVCDPVYAWVNDPLRLNAQ